MTLASGRSHPGSVVTASGRVYWSDGNGVMAVSASGGAVTTTASIPFGPVGLALDAANLYWLEGPGNSDGSGTVMSTPRAGGSVTTLATGVYAPASIAVDSSYVYWGTEPVGGGATAPATIARVPTGGGTPQTLASDDDFLPSALAVDAIRIYFTETEAPGSGGAVCGVPLAGGTPFTIASNADYPAGIAVDATSLYWADYDDPGSVARLTPK